jgi:hypothetical protein
LTRCVLSTVEDQFGDDDCLYQHDSAPCHKAKSVRELFEVNKMPEMDCPAQSHDLNPTEHLWDELERRLRFRPRSPTSLTVLATALQEEWAAIQLETFRQVVESLPHNGKGWAHLVFMSTTGSVSVSSGCRDSFDEIVYILLKTRWLLYAPPALTSKIFGIFPTCYLCAAYDSVAVS